MNLKGITIEMKLTELTGKPKVPPQHSFHHDKCSDIRRVANSMEVNVVEKISTKTESPLPAPVLPKLEDEVFGEM